MEWNEGHTWTLDTTLPADSTVSFKLVVMQEDGSARWEAGDANRSLAVPAMPIAAPLPPTDCVTISCAWDNVHSTVMEVRPDRRVIEAHYAALQGRIARLLQHALMRGNTAGSAGATDTCGCAAVQHSVPEQPSACASFEDTVAADSLALHVADDSLGRRVLAATAERLLAAARAALEHPASGGQVITPDEGEVQALREAVRCLVELEAAATALELELRLAALAARDGQPRRPLSSSAATPARRWQLRGRADAASASGNGKHRWRWQALVEAQEATNTAATFGSRTRR